MISIQSYFCSSRGTDFVLIHPDLEYLIPNSHYINGAIELNVDGVVVLDCNMWDLIDQLWSYITRMLEKFRSADKASFYFPDQPLKISLERIKRKGYVKITSHAEVRRSAVTREDDLIGSLKAAGIEFCKVMNRLDSRHNMCHELMKLESW